ncbi:NDR1/HIN1-like protein 1 [Prosopis cineraria]|uniref:NDR1/HIN1-like protein 1 n=2 Tax=Prosopis cineraria TaxID=364024 RepID=UPI00241065C1|nr:NDR1/HIN1-like protein 1 [Prosopis cineraria]
MTDAKNIKVCDHHKDKRRKIFRRIFAGILIFLLIVLVTILIIWAILRPSKPAFILQDVTVYAFNASVPNFLTSNFQVTLSSRNPNDKIGIYYDRLDAYVSYQNQQITYRTSIPPSYQGHDEVDVWSPFVYGTNVPVAPFNFVTLSQDQSNGNVLVIIKIDGRVRWKVGAFISGRYHIYVRCPAFITFGPRSNGIVVGENAVKYQLVQRCTVSV